MRKHVLASPRRARALRVITLGLLLLGYLDLVRGGLTAAPLLLVSSYLLLVPLAILFD
ncbi:MAG: hypothetical protein HOQ17_06790 [Gemmatimonadaceae bacterium]|nr:hypothetical protein [Gemmatimonadaceae bacterium]NUP70009.1 hypothetical protein [Gemmatimonadaceae bacterium]NUR34946.1 hypothetical protein [Gemmatimonadaceae bacterium]NUS32751.1 hypothetical protein [Gemmatimonadaceae bacterium]NUS47207.1 hypothetical protein [Gemmatimonadaceae bacterium]